MITIEQHLCNSIWRFVKAHVKEIKDTYENLGFKNKTDMLNAIKLDWQTALWALTGLCAWGMEKNYLDNFLVYEADNYTIYKIGNRFIKNPYFEDGIIEVKQVVKMIPVIDWEEVK
jgi:hypothetical protein